MSNRVDELETKVKELQAAVNGLTEELVESKERIRQLENAVDVDDPAVRASSRRGAQETQAAAETTDSESESAAEAEAEAEDDSEPEQPEQRFVDAEEHESELENQLGPEGSNDEEAKSEQSNDEETESEGSDIIVA